MTDDGSFLRALLANPTDRTARLVYADYLDDRGDPRAEYVRLAACVAELPPDDPERPAPRARMLALQPALPPWWVAIVGGLRASPADEPDLEPRIDDVARVRGRPTRRTDEKGYTLTVEAAAVSGLTDAVAYLESRSKWDGHFHDIHYHLNLRRADGHVVAWEPYTYNPYFGCETKFMEWYGDAVVFIYAEKHDHYIARFGFDAPARYHKLENYWVLDGSAVAFIGYRETQVKRVSVPDLEPLPALSMEEATRRDLMPETPAWWRNG